MKIYEYEKGQQAQNNFEEGMKALFKIPKDEVARAEKRKKKSKTSRAQSVRKQRLSDKD